MLASRGILQMRHLGFKSFSQLSNLKKEKEKKDQSKWWFFFIFNIYLFRR
jgi:hypothetical protein